MRARLYVMQRQTSIDEVARGGSIREIEGLDGRGESSSPTEGLVSPASCKFSPGGLYSKVKGQDQDREKEGFF